MYNTYKMKSDDLHQQKKSTPLTLWSAENRKETNSSPTKNINPSFLPSAGQAAASVTMWRICLSTLIVPIEPFSYNLALYNTHFT